jgi:hypothetical protein
VGPVAWLLGRQIDSAGAITLNGSEGGLHALGRLLANLGNSKRSSTAAHRLPDGGSRHPERPLCRYPAAHRGTPVAA